MNKLTIETMKHIHKIYDSLVEIALQLIETEARQLMKDNPDAKEFVMCDGENYFYDKSDKAIIGINKFKKEFNQLIADLDKLFEITSYYPMSFKAKGKVYTDIASYFTYGGEGKRKWNFKEEE